MITVAAFIKSYVCSTSTNNRTDVPPPRMNEVLTPPACQTLINIYIDPSGKPYSVADPSLFLLRLCHCQV